MRAHKQRFINKWSINTRPHSIHLTFSCRRTSLLLLFYAFIFRFPFSSFPHHVTITAETCNPLKVTTSSWKWLLNFMLPMTSSEQAWHKCCTRNWRIRGRICRSKGRGGWRYWGQYHHHASHNRMDCWRERVKEKHLKNRIHCCRSWVVSS